MPVSDEHKAVFIHIPKTGGTSIEFIMGMHGDLTEIGIKPYIKQKKNYSALFGDGLQHLDCKELFNFLSRRSPHQSTDQSSTFFRLAIIKARVSSIVKKADYSKILERYYVFSVVRNPYDRLVSQMAWEGGKWAKGRELDVVTFQERTKKIFSTPKNKIPRFLRPQHEYLLINDKLYLNDVFFFEDLQGIFSNIRKRFGLKTELPHRMKSHHLPWQDYYDSEIRSLVYEYYRKDFESFSYEK